MQRVIGAVQHYAWGDPEFIPTLLGLEPDGRPWAELWLGTHPNGPTRCDDGRVLADVAGPLPYLLKVLAASEPLSLQTHPNADQAVDGHRRGVFADRHPKPELLVALTRFEALCGVRPGPASVALLDDVGAVDLRDSVAARGPGPTIDALYRGRLDPQPTVDACADSHLPEAEWVRRLSARYPGEPSVVVALLLNLVVLDPGQALRLDAGSLHAYLGGAGIELMGASDNVVRGGLTVKHVDVDELLRVADLRSLADPTIPAGNRYELPAADVALIRLSPGAEHVASGRELTIDLAGTSWYLEPGDRLTASVTTFVVVPIGSPV